MILISLAYLLKQAFTAVGTTEEFQYRETGLDLAMPYA